MHDISIQQLSKEEKEELMKACHELLAKAVPFSEIERLSHREVSLDHLTELKSLKLVENGENLLKCQTKS